MPRVYCPSETARVPSPQATSQLPTGAAALNHRSKNLAQDGSPQRVELHATALWHFDAAEWAPSTASLADIAVTHLQQEASIFLWSHFRQLLSRVES